MPPQPFLDAIADGPAYTVPPAFVCFSTAGDLETAYVRVVGELDIATAPELDRALRKPRMQARMLILDLRELTFMASAGAWVILAADARAREHGRRFVVIRDPLNLNRMFTAARGFDRLEIRDLGDSQPAVQVLLQLAQGHETA